MTPLPIHGGGVFAGRSRGMNEEMEMCLFHASSAGRQCWPSMLLPAVHLFAQSTPLLVDVDHRAATSLDGAWHAIIDPYGNGLYNSDGSINLHGYGENRQPKSKSDLVEYSFAKSPTLQVPGDWNTQRKDLLFYEGVVWYEKDFAYTPRPNTRTFLHVGAANYRAYVFVNGSKICQHEGGFTPFDCDATSTCTAETTLW